jgi:hypothetical protein
MTASINAIALLSATTLTIASGVVTAINSEHIIAAQSGTTDDLDTITAGHEYLSVAGSDYRPQLYIRADTGDKITLKHGTGNLALTGNIDIVMDDETWCLLKYDGTNWININLVAPSQLYATFVVGAETGGNTINVTIQITNEAGADVTTRKSVMFYLADDATGDIPSADVPSGGIAIGTDGAMIEWVTDLSGLLISEADGDIDINIIEAAADTWYLVCVMPDGKLQISGAITFA